MVYPRRLFRHWRNHLWTWSIEMTDTKFPMIRAKNGRRLPAMTIEDAVSRCLSRAYASEKGCLVIDCAGFYPTQDLQGKSWRASRLIWTSAHGDIPPGLVVRHKCDNSKCVNIDHLEIGTPKENSQDIIRRNRHANLKKTHCRNGHPYNARNTSVMSNGKTRNPSRVCLVCKRFARIRYLEKIAND
jgi:hypothetical protein